MFYAVLVARKGSRAEQLAQALSDSSREPATVYVVGMTDEDALADVLIEGVLRTEADEITSAEALMYPWVEVIGKEDGMVSEDDLVAIAKKRIIELDRKPSSKFDNAVSR